MSADLQWLVVRNNHSFLVRQRFGGKIHQFSSESGNVMNKHTFKFSGLCNKRTVDVSATDKKVTLALKKSSARKVKSSVTDCRLGRHYVNGSCKAAKTINTVTAASSYRPDLTKFAIARYHALRKSLKTDGAVDFNRKRKGRK